MKTVAILGANGFVGYACSEHFSKNGYEVISLIRDNSSQIRNLDNFDHLVIKYKSLDDKDLIQEVSSHNPDLLINAAWNGVSGKYRNELFQLEDNLNLTQKSIIFCNAIGSKKWLGFGSQAEYGNKNRTVKEEDILTPTTKYGESKVKCLNESIEMCNKLGIEHIWLRLFDFYGPQDSPNWLIPYVIKKSLSSENIDLTACDQYWDFLYIADLANAIESIFKKDCSGIYNVGSGQAVKLKDIIEMIIRITQSSSILNYGVIPYRDDQVMYLKADINKIKNKTSWIPKVGLEEGLTLTIEWLKNA